MDALPTRGKKEVRAFANEDDAIIAYELGARGLETSSRIASEREDGEDPSPVKHAAAKVTLHEPVDVVVKAWDAEAGELRDQQVRTTVGRILFNRILPQELRFTNQPMKRADLKRLSGLSDQVFADRVDVDYAHTTTGNAEETRAWAKAKGYTRLIVVTSSYHMPRSMLEFTRAMPDIEIVPNPVFPEFMQDTPWWQSRRSATLIASEYSKYLAAMVRPYVPAALLPSGASD